MSYGTPTEYLKTKIGDRRTEIEQHLGRGAAKDFNEYQKLCGFLQGLEFAKELIIDLQKRMENDEDE